MPGNGLRRRLDEFEKRMPFREAIIIRRIELPPDHDLVYLMPLKIPPFCSAAGFTWCLSACVNPPTSSATHMPHNFHPTAWLAETLAKRDPSPRKPDPSQPAVVLIHGIDGSGRDMTRLARALAAGGRRVHCIDLVPNDGSAPIEELSSQLHSFVSTHVPDGEAFDLAGYSMGGLVARHYLQEREGHLRVRRFVSISSPHHGTLVASLRSKPGTCQMRRGSDFLENLSQPDSLAKLPPTTSFQTVTDLIIVPFTSSTLAGANNIRLFGWGHFTGVIESHAIRRVVAELNRD